MERQILVPLDGSALSETVQPHAIAMARATSSALALLRVVPNLGAIERRAWPAGTAVTQPRGAEREFQLARAYLREIAGQLRGDGFEVSTHILEGNPAAEIIDYSRNDATVTMVAMATHGRSGISRWVFGSVAEKVLHAATKPLLLVHAPGEAPRVLPRVEYHTILVPLDGSTFAEQALGLAQEMAQDTQAHLLLVAVVPHGEDPDVVEAGMVPLWVMEKHQGAVYDVQHALVDDVQRLATTGLDVRMKIATGKPAEEILKVATHEQADLIVMATHGRGGLARLWMGSVASKVVQSMTGAVLLLRATEPAEASAAAPSA
jgi:nucleotide-binding universal stress UspA family protein